MLDRARIVDEQFIHCVQTGIFPLAQSTPHTASSSDKNQIIDIFDSQMKSRLLDLIARNLKEKGLSFYTIGSSGHEGNAAIAQMLGLQDMAFLHYRSGAFYIQRAKQHPDHDGVRDILLSLTAAASDPISGGRHKVFGSLALNIPPQTSTIASHLPKALGAAMSITRARELQIAAKLAPDAVILCSFGDASLNHASAQTTLNATSWLASQSYPLPLIFVCEDNGIGISVMTPEGWVEKSVRARSHIDYICCDGLNIIDTAQKTQAALTLARTKKRPVFLHMRCVRLLGHAGSDIESQYRSQAAISTSESQDPLLHTARIVYASGFMTQDAILTLYEDNRKLIEAKAMEAVALPKMQRAAEVMASIIPPQQAKTRASTPDTAARARIFGSAMGQLTLPRNLCQNINFALSDLMLQYPEILVFGEDVGKKGGVYRVTADLQARFGQRRVFDTLLDETTILGSAIGLAHNGFLPIPEIQFLAYLHNAEDQLRGEAATLSFFSNGQYTNPMVIRIAGLGYQKGFGGHFHNDNSISVLRDIPGLIVACPAQGSDAAKMLRTCVRLAHEEGRVIVFLEPIALYMTKDLHQTGDNGWLCQYPEPDACIPFGEVGVYGHGNTAILSYANGFYLARQAQKPLREKHQIDVKIIDLRWLTPLPIQAILREMKGIDRILIVDEGRKSGSLSEELMTLLWENNIRPSIMKRITGEDCFIPLGQAWEYILPSKNVIIDTVLAMHNRFIEPAVEEMSNG